MEMYDALEIALKYPDMWWYLPGDPREAMAYGYYGA